jgi:hypothetical protein
MAISKNRFFIKNPLTINDVMALYHKKVFFQDDNEKSILERALLPDLFIIIGPGKPPFD